MATWWHSLCNSVERLSQLSYRLQVASVILALLVAILMFIAFVAGKRGRALESAVSERQQKQWDEERQRLKGKAESAVTSSPGAANEAQQERPDLIANKEEGNKLPKEDGEWRTLSKEQHSTLVSKLSQYAGQQIMVLALVAGGEETRSYAQLIGHALQDAGWNPLFASGSDAGPGLPAYVLGVVVSNSLNHPVAADKLLDALREANIPVEGEVDSTLQANSFRLVVRPKRLKPQ